MQRRPLPRRQFNRGLLAATAALAAAALPGLVACSKPEEPGAPPEPPVDMAQAYEVVAAQGKGFTVGAMMAANPVYVFFDPQCPHCGHLWQASLLLHGQVKFVWLPVAFLGPKSLPQGAALLQSAQPLDAMSAHERSLLAGDGGSAASASIPAEIEATIQANTKLLNRLGAESVPFVVARHRSSGQVLTYAGAMDAAALARFLGLG